MDCPKCKNKDFEPTEDVKRPLINLGGKVCFSTVDIRRYACLQCGFKFKSQEIFYMEMEVPIQNKPGTPAIPSNDG